MLMYHPDLPYTKKNGGVEVTEDQFRLAWQPAGWKPIVTPDELPDDGGEEE